MLHLAPSGKKVDMSVLDELKPSPLWQYFGEICKIPRLSKNEGRIRQYLIDFARKNNLEAREDAAGNILITREASAGMEDRKTIVLQSHMDMVGEKNAGHPHNWMEDPIVPVIRGEWVTADGTTLGADDGIGIACQLAILTDSELRAGKIECLFTADEETGMTGAINLDPGFFTGRTLINLDSEDEGILFIGCAGGLDTVGTMTYRQVAVKSGMAALEISLTGLHGGHSGDEIHKGYGNSVKIMNRILSDISAKTAVSLAWFDAGNLRNAIPKDAFATIVLDPGSIMMVTAMADEFTADLKEEYGDLEKDFTLSVKEVPVPEYAMDPESQEKLISLLHCCPHGVIAWSKEMEDLVETSTNLASAKFSAGSTIKIVTTQRSSVESAKHEVASAVEDCMVLGGAEVTHSEGYPGWKPDLSSAILKITRESYLRLFGKEPLVRAIHAGLECGLIHQKVEDIDMISFGPTIKGAHTPEEMIEIRTAQMFWDLLVDVVRSIPSR
jgi:dipeptidase D